MNAEFRATSPGWASRSARALQLMLMIAPSLGLVLLLSGCAAWLPSSQTTPKSPWKSYEEAKTAFDQIRPSQTRTSDLKALGFDPSSPNVRVLTYLDVIQRFIPNQSITKEDLAEAVRDCLEAKDGCRALELELDVVKGKRTGNVLLDIFGFVRKNRETGWRFKALLVLRDDLVVYKLSSGEPTVDRFEERVKPLGPLQELDDLLPKGVP